MWYSIGLAWIGLYEWLLVKLNQKKGSRYLPSRIYPLVFFCLYSQGETLKSDEMFREKEGEYGDVPLCRLIRTTSFSDGEYECDMKHIGGVLLEDQYIWEEILLRVFRLSSILLNILHR